MYVGWRDLRRASGRFALIAGVVLLITVLVGLLTGLTQGLGRESTSAITGLQTNHLVLSGDSFDASQVGQDAVPGATGLGITRMRAEGPDGSGTVALFGVPAGSDLSPAGADVAPGRVVLSDKAGEQVGTGKITIAGQQFEVVRVTGDDSYAHQPVVWMDLADQQQLTGSTGEVTALAVDRVPADLPRGLHAVTLDKAVNAIGGYSSEHGSLLMIQAFLLAISALVIGAFFTVWTIQRSPDIAVLKALGATTGTLVRDALAQAGVVLLAGTVLGGALAWLIGLAAAQAVPFSLPLANLVLPLALLVLLGLVGASLAVRQVVSVDPLNALRK